MTASRRTVVDGSKLAVFTVVSLIVDRHARRDHGQVRLRPDRGVLRGLLQRQPDPEGRRRPGRRRGPGQGRGASRSSTTDDAKVDFTVAEDLPLTDASQVEIRYLNLVGDRYLAISEGKPGAAALEPGAHDRR